MWLRESYDAVGSGSFWSPTETAYTQLQTQSPKPKADQGKVLSSSDEIGDSMPLYWSP